MSGLSFVRTSHVVALVTVLAVLGVSASADFVYTSQQRYVQASFSAVATATDFSPFSETVSSHWVMEYEADLTTTASQTSTLGATSIFAETSATMTGWTMSGGGQGESIFVVSFTLPTSTPYSSVTTSAVVQGWWKLTGPDLLYGGPPYGTPVDMPPTGVLPAGDYTLEVKSMATIGAGNPISGSSSFSLTIIPEPSTLALLAVAAIWLKRTGH